MAAALAAGDSPRRSPRCTLPPPQFPDLANAGPAAQRVFSLIDREPPIDLLKASGRCWCNRELISAALQDQGDWLSSRLASAAGLLIRRQQPPAPLLSKQAGADPPIDGDIELKGVTFAYPARPGRLIFKEFNLAVKAGTSCALVSLRRPWMPVHCLLCSALR